MAVDSSFWLIRPNFGVAGGPFVFVLSDAGNLRAFRVGARVDEDGARALQELAARGGEGVFVEKYGSKLRSTPLGQIPQTVWGKLRMRGLVESFGSDGVRLTPAGSDAIAAGHEEQEYLLRRVEREHAEELLAAGERKSNKKSAWYHGSPINGLKELKREENPKRVDSAGLWFTTDPDFAADNFGPHLYEAKAAICAKPATLLEDQLYAPWSLYWDLALVRRFAPQRVRGFAPGGPPDSWSEARREDAAEVWQMVKFNTSYVRAWRNKQLAEGRKCFLFPDLVGFDGWERRQSILLVLDPPTIAVRQLR